VNPLTDAPPDVKSCCAAAYSSELVRLLVGDRMHPGGAGLTRHTTNLLNLTAGARVLDVACGRGDSALQVAAEHDVHVVGVDLSPANAAAATAAAAAAGVGDRVEFRVADAEALPFADASFDAVLCECALCTFPNKPAAAAQLARVLRPGGRLGLSDVVAEPDRLPEPLRGLAARVACIGDARPTGDYVRLLTDAGLRVDRVERHDQAAAAFVERIQARLLVARMALRDRPTGLDLDAVTASLEQTRAAIADGALGYAVIVATRPTHPR